MSRVGMLPYLAMRPAMRFDTGRVFPPIIIQPLPDRSDLGPSPSSKGDLRGHSSLLLPCKSSGIKVGC